MAVETTEKSARLALWIRLMLLLTVLGVFFGRAWILDRGETKIYAFLQNEDLAREFVEEKFEMSWNRWVSDDEVREKISNFVRWQSRLHAAAGIACILLMLIPRRKSRPLLALKLLLVLPVLLATLDLCFFGWLSYLDAGEIPFHYLEYAARAAAPLAFLLAVVCYTPAWHQVNLMILRLALAATFAVHGLYALGYEIEDTEYRYETPGSWIEMSVNGLGRIGELTGHEPPDEEMMVPLLQTAGILDLVAAVLVFIPYVSRLGLLYMVFWGGVTAAARTWSHYLPELAGETLMQWIPETLIRIPHFTLPLFLLVLTFQRGRRYSADS